MRACRWDADVNRLVGPGAPGAQGALVMAGMDELLAVGWRRRTMDSRGVAGNSLMAWHR